MSNTSTAEPDTEDTTPIHVTGDSPDRIDVPIWVIAQTKLAPPLGRTGKPRPVSAVLDVVMFLLGARFGTSPDDTVRVDRAAIARWVGARPDTLKWVFEYLELIGFLTVHRGVRDAVHGGRTPDRFQISLAPPNGYRGPRTFVELNLELTAVYPGQDHNHSGMGKVRDLTQSGMGKGAVYPGQDHNHSGMGKVRDLTQSGMGKGAVYPGQDHNHPGMGFSRARSDQNLIFSFGEGGEDQMERANAGAPEAPATPAANDEHHVAAESIASGLDWQATATRLGATLDVSRTDWAALVDAIASRLRSGEVDASSAAAIAAAALSQASKNPVAFASRAFGDDRTFAKQRAAVDRVVLAEPVPFANDSEAPSAHSAGQPKAASPTPVLPACPDCEAAEGAPISHRHVQRSDGYWQKCHCAHPSAA